MGNIPLFLYHQLNFLDSKDPDNKNPQNKSNPEQTSLAKPSQSPTLEESKVHLKNSIFSESFQEKIYSSVITVLKSETLSTNEPKTPEEESLSHLQSFKLFRIAREYLKTEGPRLCAKVKKNAFNV